MKRHQFKFWNDKWDIPLPSQPTKKQKNGQDEWAHKIHGVYHRFMRHPIPIDTSSYCYQCLYNFFLFWLCIHFDS